MFENSFELKLYNAVMKNNVGHLTLYPILIAVGLEAFPLYFYMWMLYIGSPI
jgi:hypothetical protein